VNRKIDVIIVGGGIAGTCLAWTLFERGYSFVLIDDGAPLTASRVAAGLVTPITGRRLNASYNWSIAFSHCDQFYQQIEQRLAAAFWYRSGAVRLRDAKLSEDDVKERLKQFPEIETVWLDSNWFDEHMLQNNGGFFMPQACRLDVNRFLQLSHQFFETRKSIVYASVDLDEDIFVHPQNVYYRMEDVSASYVICCRGIADQTHHWFEAARFNPAQGDILQIEFDRPLHNVTMHSNWWMTPVHAAKTLGCLDLGHRMKTNQWLLGSTYQWRPLNGLPSPEGRDSLLQGLVQRFNIPCQVVDHRAAIRPASFDQKPFLGMHNVLPRLGLLNGLGAKGCHLAPWCASLLVGELFDGQPLPNELRWDR
jgi:glycine/D-amino acid oxidase-like deaminating enzyme